jgi:hypothetical protein
VGAVMTGKVGYSKKKITRQVAPARSTTFFAILATYFGPWLSVWFLGPYAGVAVGLGGLWFWAHSMWKEPFPAAHYLAIGNAAAAIIYSFHLLD